MASTTGILAIAVASYSKKFQKTRPGHDISSTGHPGIPWIMSSTSTGGSGSRCFAENSDCIHFLDGKWLRYALQTVTRSWDIHGKSFCLHHFWPVVSTHPKNTLVDWGIIIPFLGKSSEPKIHQVIETYWNILKHIETYWNILKHIETYWNILKHIEAYWNILKHIETYWNILKHIETYWNILKHIETQKSWLRLKSPLFLGHGHHGHAKWVTIFQSEFDPRHRYRVGAHPLSWFPGHSPPQRPRRQRCQAPDSPVETPQNHPSNTWDRRKWEKMTQRLPEIGGKLGETKRRGLILSNSRSNHTKQLGMTSPN